MQKTTHEDFKSNLKEYMKNINENSSVLHVTSSNGNDIVVMARSEYDSITETLHLIKNSANHRHLESSIKELETEEVVIMSIEDL